MTTGSHTLQITSSTGTDRGPVETPGSGEDGVLLAALATLTTAGIGFEILRTEHDVPRAA